MLKKIKIKGTKINDFSTHNEIENIFLKSLVIRQMHLKLNKDFMKNFKKSDQLEGEEKIFLKLKK